MSNVIKLLWEYGGLSAVPNTSKATYHISIVLEDGHREEFGGEDIDAVKKEAMEYILSHYRKEHINTLKDFKINH